MAARTLYVDTDIAESGDGSSWEEAFQHLSEAEALNLTLTSGDDEGVCTIYCRGTTADTYLTWDGWTTDSTHYVLIKGDNTTGIYNTSAYRLESTTWYLISIQDQDLRFEDMQFENSEANSYLVYYMSAIAYDIRFNRCIFKGGTSRGFNLELGAAGASITFINCLFFDCGGESVYCYNTNIDIFIYNCTFADNSMAVQLSLTPNSITMKNCVFTNNSTTFTGTFPDNDALCDYNFDDQSSTGDGDPIGSHGSFGASFTFESAAGDDWHLAAGDSGAQSQGVDLSGLFTDDIDDDVRSGDWDAGFDQVVSGGDGGSIVPLLMQQRRRRVA